MGVGCDQKEARGRMRGRNLKGRILAIIPNYKTEKYQVTFECDNPDPIREYLKANVNMTFERGESHDHVQKDRR